MARPIVITGADANYFLMGCVLMRSLAQSAPGLPFYFLDFGLEEPQRRFLSGRKVLIDRPSTVPENLHPIVGKMAIGEYLRELDWSAVLWLDSDMLTVGSLSDSLAEVLAGMAAAQREVAACSVETINELFAGGWPMAPFAEALRAERISLDSSYYNNGTVVFRSAEFLKEWWKLARKTPVHMCIDQNLFNLLALRHNRIMHLPARTWNLHGMLLAEARAVTENGQQRIVAGEGTAMETALVLHPTSIRDEYHEPINCSVGRGRNQVMKLFRKPVLRACQIKVLSELIADAGEALADAGVDRPNALLEAANAQAPLRPSIRDPGEAQTWGKVGRLEACPCGSGKRYKHCHGQYV
jgi:hypothetical protein